MTINGSTNNNQWTYKLEVSETATSIQDRTSTIQVKTYLGRASSQSYIGGNYSNSVSVTGANTQSQSGNIPYPTYINGGAWLLLKTFTFVVPNTGNPTTVTISSSFSSGDFTPSSASASGSMQLTVLHLDPVINTATMVETNSVLTALNVPDTTIVQYLSKKTITLNVTTYDGATASYRLRHFNTNYNIPSANTYQSSSVFNTDYTNHDIAIGSGKANIIQDISDNLGGTNTDWVYVNIDGTAQKPNGIAYTKPTIVRANTSIKRKSGGGTTLTDNKAVLNFKGTFYKGNNVIGNNNNIQQIGYKIWEKGTTEPSNYTTLTPTISGGNVTVSNLEISNMVYTKTYNYKFIFKDRYGYQDTIMDGTLPTGVSVFTEYKDRVDFEKITLKNSYKIMGGKSLYYNVSGTDADFILSDNFKNYKRIDIFYGFNTWGSANNCVSFYPANTGTVCLTVIYAYSGTTLRIATCGMNFNNKNVTFDANRNALADLRATGVVNFNTNSNILVYEVIGYNE